MIKEMFSQNISLQKRQQKELYFAMRYKGEIKKRFNHFVDNTRLIFDYLKNDFEVKKIQQKDENGIIESLLIQEAIDDLEIEFVDKIKIKIVPIRARFYGLRIIYHYYPQYLDILEKYCNSTVYKEIDLINERAIINESRQYIVYF